MFDDTLKKGGHGKVELGARGCLTEIEHLATALKDAMYRGEEIFVVAQINGEVVLEVVAVLLRLIVGKGIFASMIGVIAQTSVHNVLADAVGQALCVVVFRIILALFYALDDGGVGGSTHGNGRAAGRRGGGGANAMLDDAGVVLHDRRTLWFAVALGVASWLTRGGTGRGTSGGGGGGNI